MTVVARNAIGVVETIAPHEDCLPFLKKILLKKEKQRQERSIYTEETLNKAVLEVSKRTRTLHFDQYIDLETWLEHSDLEEDNQRYMLKFIDSQNGTVKEHMQIHHRYGRLSMLRRVALTIGLLW